MYKVLSLTLFLCFCASAYGRDKSNGAWDGKSKARRMVLFIEKLRSHFDQRRENLEKMGEKIVVPPRFGENFDDEQKKFQKSFLAGRLNKKELDRHIARYEINAVKEDKMLTKLELKYKGTKIKKNLSQNKQTKKVFDYEMTASKVGVILDVSGSMDSYTQKVKAEIKKSFPNAYVIEVNGSSLAYSSYTTEKAAWFFSDLRISPEPFEKKYHIDQIRYNTGYYYHAAVFDNNSTVLVAMSEVMKFDTIYWFSDFKDKVKTKDADKIKKILLKNKTKLILHTMKRSPKTFLRELAKATGGSVIKVKWDK